MADQFSVDGVQEPFQRFNVGSNSYANLYINGMIQESTLYRLTPESLTIRLNEGRQFPPAHLLLWKLFNLVCEPVDDTVRGEATQRQIQLFLGQRAFASDMPKLKTGLGALVMDGVHDFLQRGNVLVAHMPRLPESFPCWVTACTLSIMSPACPSARFIRLHIYFI